MIKKRIKILPGEFWYGGAVEHAPRLPFGGNSRYEIDLTVNPTYNQAAPLFLSSAGRYIWSDYGFKLTAANGEIALSGNSDIGVVNAGGTLKDAYVSAMKAKFPFTGRVPDKLLFAAPQYCTWIELQYNQTQEGILEYARSVIAAGMPAGELIIDDGWQKNYGEWRFNREKFSNPKAMVKELKETGFSVLLWLAPYVTADTPVFRDELQKHGLLIKDANGKTAVKEWWNGFSAVLDTTNPETLQWFRAQTGRLMKEYGISGFKIDGGDAMSYSAEDFTHKRVSPNEMCEGLARLAGEYENNELRACWKEGGAGLTQRLCDKSHQWDNNKGLDTLIPSVIQAGLIGHPFVCPDMIGGGQFLNFLPGMKTDEELCLRWITASALMPMMQYSKAFWRHESKVLRETAVRYAKLRSELGGYIYSLAKESAKTGMPIVQSMEFAYPHCGYETCADMFKIGKYIVAPVVTKGAAGRTVRLPAGKYKNMIDGKTVTGGEEQTFDVPLTELLWFEVL